MAGKKDLSGLKLLNGAAQALDNAIIAACREYANRGFRGEPIVYSHFTAGNQGRYAWQSLTPKYAAWKSGVTPVMRANMKTRNRKVPKGKGLPMLVLTGALKDAITSGRAKIVKTGPGRYSIRWANDPHYATYLHKGTPKMPKRSPVEPNAADMAAIWAAANRYLSGWIATGGAVPQGGAPGAKARVV